MGSPVWALAGVGQDSAGKVARGSSLDQVAFILSDVHVFIFSSGKSMEAQEAGHHTTLS